MTSHTTVRQPMATQLPAVAVPQPVSAGMLHAAMLAVAGTLAGELSADAGLGTALRAPVSLASAYSDLCASLGIDTPAAIRIALADET